MQLLLIAFVVLVSVCDCVSQAPTPTPATKMTPEQIAEMQAQRDKALKINELITRVNGAMSAKDWPTVADLAKQLGDLDPKNPAYRSALGDALLNAGKYDEAIAAYNISISLTGMPEDFKKADPQTRAKVARALTNIGNSYLKLKKNDDAVKSYEAAADLDPNPAVAYFNICTLEYNIGNVDGALAACSRSIAADPKRADAWFIKGSLLVGNSTQDKDGKLQFPPGAVEALKKYLELAPQGPHASDVKQMLDAMGVKY